MKFCGNIEAIPAGHARGGDQDALWLANGARKAESDSDHATARLRVFRDQPLRHLHYPREDNVRPVCDVDVGVLLGQ